MSDEITEIKNEVQRLPLWKNCLEDMRERGISYGETFKAEFFEQALKCSRDCLEFGFAISSIRRELEMDGFFLNGRGQGGNQFVIVPPSSNADVMVCYGRKALDALKRGVILGTSTPLDLLTKTERERHEKVLEKMATRLALVSTTKNQQKKLT